MLAIEDIGSMHGTFLNESEVPKGIAMAISNGDELIFGAEVKRGIEIFPACAFRVNYNALPYKYVIKTTKLPRNS